MEKLKVAFEKIGEISRDVALDAIRDYPNLDMRIERRKQEIENPWRPSTDDNVGGGKPQNVRSEPIEKALELKEADDELNLYYWERDAVEYVLKLCVDKQARSLLDRSTYDIIYEFYLRENQIFNADGIAARVKLSRRSVYNRRDAFIEAVRKELDRTAQKLHKTV